MALAGVFGGCQGSDETVRTVTVDRPVIVEPDPEPENPFQEQPKARKDPSSSAPDSASAEYADCDSNIQVDAETTTCAFAQNTFWHYWMSGESAALYVYSPATRTTFDVSCTVGGVIKCTTADDGVVRFPQGAVDRYSQAQADTYAAGHDLGPDPYESLTQSEPPASGDYDYNAPQSLYNAGGGNIPNYENGRGYRVQCADGMYSHSGGIQGACSGHGGVG